MSKLKLFIWVEFSSDYTDGLAFAVAKSEEEDKKLVCASYGCEPSDWGNLEVRRLDWRVGRCVGGGG